MRKRCNDPSWHVDYTVINKKFRRYAISCVCCLEFQKIDLYGFFFFSLVKSWMAGRESLTSFLYLIKHNTWSGINGWIDESTGQDLRMYTFKLPPQSPLHVVLGSIMLDIRRINCRIRIFRKTIGCTCGTSVYHSILKITLIEMNFYFYSWALFPQ